MVLSSPRLEAGEVLIGGGIGSALSGLARLVGNTGVAGLWVFEMRGGGLAGEIPEGITRSGTSGADVLRGGAGADRLSGFEGDDRLLGFGGDDFLYGGPGRDTLNGENGNDRLYGGPEEGDLGDILYGGDGDDLLDGRGGNDVLHGGAGNDTLVGGNGADTLSGNEGEDALSGGAGADEIHGGPGRDWINGGFGYDRLNGGAGGDVFYHQGSRDHGSDWIQDYRAAEGDVLRIALAGARRADFQVNFAHTPQAGAAGMAEAFIIHRPTGHIYFALVDGAGEQRLMLQLDGGTYNLLA